MKQSSFCFLISPTRIRIILGCGFAFLEGNRSTGRSPDHSERFAILGGVVLCHPKSIVVSSPPRPMISNSSEHRRFADQAFQDSLDQLEVFLTESVTAPENPAIAPQDPAHTLEQWEAAATDLEVLLECEGDEVI